MTFHTLFPMNSLWFTWLGPLLPMNSHDSPCWPPTLDQQLDPCLPLVHIACARSWCHHQLLPHNIIVTLKVSGVFDVPQNTADSDISCYMLLSIFVYLYVYIQQKLYTLQRCTICIRQIQSRKTKTRSREVICRTKCCKAEVTCPCCISFTLTVWIIDANVNRYMYSYKQVLYICECS